MLKRLSVALMLVCFAMTFTADFASAQNQTLHDFSLYESAHYAPSVEVLDLGTHFEARITVNVPSGYYGAVIKNVVSGNTRLIEIDFLDTMPLSGDYEQTFVIQYSKQIGETQVIVETYNAKEKPKKKKGEATVLYSSSQP